MLCIVKLYCHCYSLRCSNIHGTMQYTFSSLKVFRACQRQIIVQCVTTILPTFAIILQNHHSAVKTINTLGQDCFCQPVVLPFNVVYVLVGI